MAIKSEPIKTVRHYCLTCGKETDCVRQGGTLMCTECLMNPDSDLFAKGRGK